MRIICARQAIRLPFRRLSQRRWLCESHGLTPAAPQRTGAGSPEYGAGAEEKKILEQAPKPHSIKILCEKRAAFQPDSHSSDSIAVEDT